MTTKKKTVGGEKLKIKLEDDDDDEESEDSTCESTHVKSEEDIGLAIIQRVQSGKKRIFKIINPIRDAAIAAAKSSIFCSCFRP